MTKRRTEQDAEQEYAFVRQTLAKLPCRADLILEGGRVAAMAPGPVAVDSDAFDLILWLDASSGYIYASKLVALDQSPSAGMQEALAALVTAMQTPLTASDGDVPDSQDGDDPDRPDNVIAFPSSSTRMSPEDETLRAMREPVLGLPAAVRVNDEALAAAARALLAPLGVNVEFAPQLAFFDQAVASLREQMADMLSVDEEPFAWDLDGSVLAPLYRAAAGVWRRAPWAYLAETPPFLLRIGTDASDADASGARTLFASVLGGLGEVFGIALYTSLDALLRAAALTDDVPTFDLDVEDAIEMLRQAGAPVDAVPPELLRTVLAGMTAEGQSDPHASKLRSVDAVAPNAAADDAPPADDGEYSLVVLFEAREECDPSYLDWMKVHDLPYASRDSVPSFYIVNPDQSLAQPQQHDVRDLTVALTALNAFFSKYHRQLDSQTELDKVLRYESRVPDVSGEDTAAVRVVLTYPAPDFEVE